MNLCTRDILNKRTGHENPGNVENLASGPASSNSSARMPRVQTHVEVLWRTLVGDCFVEQHPAPLDAGYAFADALVDRFNVISMAQEFRSFDETLKQELFNRMWVLRTLSNSELEGFWAIPDPQPNLEDSEVVRITDPTIRDLPLEAVEMLLTRFLPKCEFADDVIGYGRERDKERISLFVTRSNIFMVDRKLFNTRKKKFLGAGPKSVKGGDCVFIIAGAKAPILLRPVGEAHEKTYRVIGEAYVHGIMHGEALREKELSFEEIILV
jgi:hypothetical protein